MECGYEKTQRRSVLEQNSSFVEQKSGRYLAQRQIMCAGMGFDIRRVKTVTKSPGSFFGGIFGFLPILIYAIADWLAWYRNRPSVERILAYANLGCAAFLTVGVVTNVGEAVAAYQCRISGDCHCNAYGPGTFTMCEYGPNESPNGLADTVVDLLPCSGE
jgi:hypothetical protein